LNVLVEQGLLSDLTPLIIAQNFDLGRLIPELVEGVKTFSDKGEFLFMPYNVETTLLMYNKSLFDKFGVAYPKNGMTWQDAVELTRKMSREDGGTVYRGLDVLNATWFQTNPYSMPYYNAKTGNSTLDDPTWAKVMAPLKQFNDIPNNQIDSKVLNKARDYFMKDRTLAMFPISFNFMQSSIADGSANGLSWDLAALPYFTDLPKISAQLSYHYFIIPPTSKVKEDAFRAIAAILTDDNVRAAARAGKEPVLKDNKIQADFAKDLSYMKDKNISAFFFDHFSLPAPSSPYDTKIRAQLSKAYTDIALNGVDMNTALRSAKEAADKLIEASKQ
jgi:multiple sugar transport system substrate-binding protein